MKHCKTCSHCELQLIAKYLKGIDFYQCDIDHHHIEEPFWEKCEQFDKCRNDDCGSVLYEFISRLRRA